MLMWCTPRSHLERTCSERLWAGLLTSVILGIGPGATGEIRGVTEFEMPRPDHPPRGTSHKREERVTDGRSSPHAYEKGVTTSTGPRQHRGLVDCRRPDTWNP